jgi:hypothetical protein
MASQYALPDLPVLAGMSPESQPMDAFKIAVAELVGKAWGEDPAKIVVGVDTGKKGADLAVAIARFLPRGKGKKNDSSVTDEWAKKVIDAVSAKADNEARRADSSSPPASCSRRSPRRVLSSCSRSSELGPAPQI